MQWYSGIVQWNNVITLLKLNIANHSLQYWAIYIFQQIKPDIAFYPPHIFCTFKHCFFAS